MTFSSKFAKGAHPHQARGMVWNVANIEMAQRKAKAQNVIADDGNVMEINAQNLISLNKRAAEPNVKPNVNAAQGREVGEKSRIVSVLAGAAPPSDGGDNVTDFVVVREGVFYLYAAHYNPVQDPPVVTIVAIANRSVAYWVQSMVCVYHSGQQEHQEEVVAAMLLVLPDHHFHDDCLQTRHRVPRVKLSPPLKILQPPPRQFNFLICFSPLHHRFDDVVQVVANLELAQRLGAQHAVVYNTSISRRLDAVLRHYVHKGFLEVLGWRGVPEPVHYKAQMGAINDCLLRNRQRADFIVYMDFDEMLVPRLHDTWPDMFRALQDASSSISDYKFQGTYFLKMSLPFQSRIMKEARALASQKAPVSVNVSAPLKASSGSWADLLPPHLAPSTNWTVGNLTDPDSYRHIGAVSFISSVFVSSNVTGLTPEELQFANTWQVSYLLKQQRTAQLWADRAKTIIDPKTVDVMGIHKVLSFARSRHKMLQLREPVGLLHHYRNFDLDLHTVKDLNLLRYSASLVQRMRKVLAELRL